MSNVIYIMCAVAMGAAISVQPPINAAMALGLGSPLLAASISILISLVFVSILWLVWGQRDGGYITGQNIAMVGHHRGHCWGGICRRKRGGRPGARHGPIFYLCGCGAVRRIHSNRSLRCIRAYRKTHKYHETNRFRSRTVGGSPGAKQPFIKLK